MDQIDRDALTRNTAKATMGYMVHALTASGAVLAFLAFMATEHGRWRESVLWLILAMIVDGIDGPLARLLEVRDRLPRISGSILDLVVDFLTYVFLPSVLIDREGLVSAPFMLVAIALILLSSLYHFARSDSKSADHYFVGFPAVWNIVVYYLLVMRPGGIVGSIVVCLFAAATFAPVNFVHPVRVRMFQPWLGLITLVWMMSSIALLWPSWSPVFAHTWLALSLGTLAALLAVGLIRTVRGR